MVALGPRIYDRDIKQIKNFSKLTAGLSLKSKFSFGFANLSHHLLKSSGAFMFHSGDFMVQVWEE